MRLAGEDGFVFARERVLAGRGQIIVGLWHDRLLYAAHYLSLRFTYRQRPMSVLVSQSGDGAWIGAVIERLAARVAWGSSTRGGLSALRALRRDVADGCSPVVTLDGPRGPRHVAKPGAVALAAATGLPIVPLSFRFTRAWALARSWDHTVIPVPGARARACWGVPVFVDRHADLAQARGALQASMDAVTARTEASTPLRWLGRR